MTGEHARETVETVVREQAQGGMGTKALPPLPSDLRMSRLTNSLYFSDATNSPKVRPDACNFSTIECSTKRILVAPSNASHSVRDVNGGRSLASSWG